MTQILLIPHYGRSRARHQTRCARHRTTIPLSILMMLISCSLPITLPAQAPSQFPKGTVLYLETSQGINTNFKSSPDLYVGEINLKPMITVIPGHLRLGATAGLAYTGKVLNGIAGPLITWRISSLKAAEFGTFGNLQLQAGANWAGSGHSLIGGGPGLELFRTLRLSLTAYRDYGDNAWWFQLGLGVNLTPTKFNNNPMPQ